MATTSLIAVIMATMAVLLITWPSLTQAQLPTEDDLPDESALEGLDPKKLPPVGTKLPTCLQQLMNCKGATADPTADCCKDLKIVIGDAVQKKCLCDSVSEGDSYTKLFGMDLTNILLFTKTCDIAKDPSTVCPGVKLNEAAAATTYSLTGIATAAAFLAFLVF